MTVGRSLGIPSPRRTYEDSPKLALGKCLTGLEIECENVRVESLPSEEWAADWKQDKDNSLRGYSMEYILKEPLFGDDLIQAIVKFCTWAREKKFEANYRTGIHIHIDVRNLEVDQLISMVVFYALFEKVIFKFIGNAREGSIFCMPFYKAEGCVPLIASAFKAKDKDMKYLASKIDRYGALNLNALAKYGSVEWRHFQTTFDSDTILSWVNLAQSFKKFAKTNPGTPNEVVAELSKGGPQTLLKKIVGDDLLSKIWYPEAERDVYQYGLPVAQDLAVLLQEDKPQLSWTSTEECFKFGTNLGFSKWVQNLANIKLEERPDNPLNDPQLANDPQLQAQATQQVRELLIAELRKFRFN